MKEKILLIQVCKENLHYLEFVKPLEDILTFKNIKFFVRPYYRISSEDIQKCSKIIICGTSLEDNVFASSQNRKNWDWIKNSEKPILGICAGMQIIGLLHGGKIKKQKEIGFYKEYFSKDFLGLFGEQEVFHLHNNFIDFSNSKEFEVFSRNKKIVQAVKHRFKQIYGVLFHPEVRQKQLILRFCSL